MSLEDARHQARQDPQRVRLEARWAELAKTDERWRHTLALAKRAGFEWYDTESAARRMADQASGEIMALHKALHAALEVFRVCIGNAAFGEFKDSNVDIRKAFTVLNRLEP